MISLPPELIQKILREVDIDVLLPFLKNDKLSSAAFKECFEVVTNHEEKHLKFWSESFNRSHLGTMQPIKGKRYLIELDAYEIDYFYGQRRKMVLNKLLDLNGFVYLYSGERKELDYYDSYFLQNLNQLLKSERLLVVGIDIPRHLIVHSNTNLDRLRYIPQPSLKLNRVIPEGKLNQKITNLTIDVPHQKIFDSISPTVFKSLETFKLCSREYPTDSESGSFNVKIKHIEFSRLKTCTLEYVSQVENLKLPKLHTLNIIFQNNGDCLYLKDIEAPELREFFLKTDSDFEVKNFVTNKILKMLFIEKLSEEDFEIKGLDDWNLTGHRLELFGTASALRSNSFIQRFSEVRCIATAGGFLQDARHQQRAKRPKPLEGGYLNCAQIEFSSLPNTNCSMIRAPNSQQLGIYLTDDDDCDSLAVFSHSYANVTKLTVNMGDTKRLPSHFYRLQKLKKLKSLDLDCLFFDLEELGLDSRAWELPNLESFHLQFCSWYPDIGDLTLDMSAPKLKSLSVEMFTDEDDLRRIINFLTLKNLPNLKELRTEGFAELIIDENMDSTIESIKSRSLLKIKANDLSNIKHMPHPIRILRHSLRKRRRT